MSAEVPKNESDYQGQFLTSVDPDAVIPGEIFPDEPREKLLGDPISYEVVYGEPGTWKDLEERAEQLLTSLSALSLRNQRKGLQVASREHRHNGPIYGRYRAAVPTVRDGAENNAARFLKTAKANFWEATGYAVMRRKRLMQRHLVDARARNMWEDFFGLYGTKVRQEVGKNTARGDYQKKLEKQLKSIHEVKQARAHRGAA